MYVYSGLTLGSGVDVTNTGNVVFVEQGAYLTNYGTVSSSSGVGVSLYGDTTLTNEATGTITSQSAAAVTAYGSGISITNYGSIGSYGGQGIYFTGSGSITNSGAITSGSGYGITADGGTVSVTNYGSISGGNVGVAIAYGTITNAGTISGASYAVTITGSGTVVDDAGSVFNGQVAAYYGAGSVLDLAGSGYGTLNGLGTQFTGFGTLEVTSGTWVIENNGVPFYGPIYNDSVITGGATGVGVSVYTGGFLYNASGATITAQGAAAVSAYGSNLSIINNGGYITSASGAGIYLTGTGTIANYGGTITSGTGYGIAQSGGTAYITNTGYIGGGNVGVAIAYGTITTSGTISGGSYAVTITGSGTLVVDPGAVFYGQVSAYAGGGSVLDLAGTGDGTLTGLGSQITGFGTLDISSGTWTVQNGAPYYGVINNYSVVTSDATGTGINLYTGGSLYNADGATITTSGGAAVYATGSGITIANDGLITSASGSGIYLSGYGTITNYAGTISSGTGDGIQATGGSAYITNYGSISGGDVGVQIDNGTITNGSTGVISGGTYAVQITGTGTVVDDVGSVFNGTVAATYGSGSILDLAGSGSGTLNGLGTQFTGFDTLTVTSGTWTIHNGAGFYGAIDNYSVVTGGATGVGLSVYSGGSLYNADGATITAQGAAAVAAGGSGISITNDGLITSTSGNGIYLTGYGTITNAGTIESTSAYGISANGGAAYIYNSGTITGGAVGVEISNGTITNSGTISGASYAVTITGTGTLIDDVGSVFNGQVSAYYGNGSVLELAGAGAGVMNGLGTQFTGFDTLTVASGSTWTIHESVPFYGSINNYGVLTGGTSGVGISVYGTATLYNAAGGTIVSTGANAVVGFGTGVSIINDGVIQTASGTGVYLYGTGTITNNAGASITSGSGYGIVQSGGTAYILNYGVISSTSGVGVEIANGTITNDGTISGATYAVVITGTGTLVDDTGSVFNGSVSAYYGNGSVLDLGGTGTGTLNGLGTQFTGFDTLTVSSGTWTIHESTPFYGPINNYGVITGGTTGVGVSVYGTGTLYNAAGGTIIATGANAVVGFGSNIGITNDGLIQTDSGTGIYLYGTGTITNNAGASITAGSGYGMVQTGGTAYILNYGVISSTSGVGIEITNGTITNAGTISGGTYAVVITGTGTLIDDTGSVFNGQVSAYYGNGSILDLAGTGTGTLNGLGTQFTGFDTLTVTSGTWTIHESTPFYGPINNYGVITGGTTGVGISVYGTGTLYNAASGTISAYNAGAVVGFGSGVSITNDGVIQTDSGTGIYLYGSGTITNNGMIYATTGYGVAQSGGTVSIVNYGTIVSTGGVGVQIDNGTITNDGTISGASYAVTITGDGTLVVGTGAVFYGYVAGTTGNGDVLELTSGGAETLYGFGTQFTGFDTVQFDTGSSWTVDALASVAGTTNFTGDLSGATLDLTGGGILTTNESGFGTLELSGTSIFTQPNITIAAGLLSIDAGSMLLAKGQIAAPVYSAGTVEANLNSHLRIQQEVTGSGFIGARAGGTLALTGGFDWSGNLVGPGTIALSSTGTLESSEIYSAGVVDQSATVTLAAGVVAADKGAWNITTAKSTSVVSMDGGAGSEFITHGTLTTSGPGTVDVRTDLYTNGQVNVDSGTLSLLGGLTDNGTMTALGGSVINIATKVGGAGQLNIGTFSLLNLEAGTNATQTVDFQSTAGQLDLGNPSTFLGTIVGFGGADVLDLLKTVVTGLSYNTAKDVLTVTGSSGTLATLHISGNYTSNSFTFGTDHHAGSLITFV